MKERILREPVRVLFHLNGYTKVSLQCGAGRGLGDGVVWWDIPTHLIPAHLRKIGSRFLVEYTPLDESEMDDVDAIHGAKNRIVIRELKDE
jgi:hypothetical protein